MKSYNEILSDVTKTATKIPQSDYLDTGKYRIFDQGKEYSVGFSNDEQGVVSDYPYIIFGDHTRVVKYVNEPCFIGADGVKLLKVINKDFNPRFVYYNILAKPIENQGYARHFKFLKEIQFTEKTLSVQTNIVTELDTIQSAIDNKKQQLALLDEAVKSRFIEMFGDNPIENGKWKVEKLGNLGLCKNGMNFSYEDNGFEINCLGVGDFKDNAVISNCEKLPVISLNEKPSEEYLLKDNDIVFVRSNGNKELVGRSVLVHPRVLTTFSGFCIRFRLSTDSINHLFLLQFLKMPNTRKNMAGRGANIQNLNQQILSNLDIPVPQIELQNNFATFVQQIDKSKFVVKQQIADLQELLDSKMQEYFS